MSDNLYAPPQAELVTPSPTVELQAFYVVSQRKFLTLFILTLGIYQLFWAYKNWQQFKLANGGDIWPVGPGRSSRSFSPTRCTAKPMLGSSKMAAAMTGAPVNWRRSM